MGKKTRRDHGTPQANGHPHEEEARLARAEAGQGPEADGAQEAEGDVAFLQISSALKRLVTEPGETWVLQGEPPDADTLQHLGAWSRACGVMVLIFRPEERFTVVHTQPGDTVLLHTVNPDTLNLNAFVGWANDRGLRPVVLPHEARLEYLDDATLDQLGLQRKNRLLVLPSGAGVPQNIRGDEYA